MSVRSRIADPPAGVVAKTFGTAVPDSFRQGEIASQMTPASPFSPGQPIGPYDGYDRHPRAFNYQTAYNVATRPRTNEALSFATLQGLFQTYDIANICLWHRIDSIRSLDWKLLPADHVQSDVTDAVPLGLKALRKPDRINSFKTWLAKFLYDVLAYDAGTLYRLRNRAGRCIGLTCVDGTTIAPLLDYWGNPPQPPAEAFVQYVNGLPWNWLTRDDIIYEPFRPRPNSPYGHAPIESIMLNANCYSDDTEVLTDRGWLRFAEVDISSDRFATRNPATAEFEWQSATRYYEADSDGTMYRAASRNVDLLVTGGHRLLVDRLPRGCPGVRHGSEWLVHAEDLYEYQSALPGRGRPVCCPATSAWGAPDLECLTLPVTPADFVRMNGEAVRAARAVADFPVCSLGITHATVRRAERGERLRRASAEAICDAYGLPRIVIREDPHYFSRRIEGDDFAAFMGMYLSEGCVRPDGPNITIAQEEYSKGYVEYRDLLARMLGREAPYHRGAFTFGHTALADYLRPLGKAHEKYIPREVLGMSARQLEIFWHFYVLGDGAIYPRGDEGIYPRTEIVSTCSKRLADGLQEVLQKIGISGAVRPVGRPAKPTHHQRWQIQTRYTSAYRVNIERVPYEGKVYCVSVPSKTLYVRRNGYPAWCANTDLRFQTYFLQRFTDGNLPAAFASSPESWSPDQIEQFQGWWDSFMYGDQTRKHQIRWMPGGSKMMWSNEKDFTDTFSLFLMRKTTAAFHVVPADIGFTENVNRSSGESQADVQHRVGDLPLMEHVEGILSAFLLDDLGLPLRFEFDRGEEQVDQLAQAEADQKYMDRGVVGASEIREIRYGLTDATPVPRVFFTERAGPIPLASLYAVAGQVDAQTSAPAAGADLPHTAFEEAPGVQPNPPLYGQPLAEEIYGPSAIPAGTETASTRPVAKEGEGAAPGPAAGITAGTGIYSYDLERGDEPDEAAVAKAQAAEMAAFRRFERARRKAGAWRDFEFRAVERVCGHNLNDAGRLSVRKAAGEVAVAGLAVLAADTGRVLMLQRAICDDDPASGDLEFPGGHLEEGESPLQAAWREWSEETGAVPPPGVQTGEWTSANGIYRGIVWTTEAEASVPVRGGAVVPNPDDPDGDSAEAIMWMDPADLPGNPMVRAELAADLDAVMAALGPPPSPACCGAECCQDGGCCGGTGGCTCAPPAEVVKAGPKVPDREHPGPEPIWGAIEDRRAKLTRSHLKAVLAAWNALAGTLDSRALVRQYRDGTVAKYADPDRNRALDLAAAWLATLALAGGWAAFTSAIGEAIRSAMAEGEADALAVAADRQGVKGFRIGPAYDAAYARLGDDLGIAAQADDAARKMLDGTAAAVSGVLAGSGSEDGEDETPDAVDGTVTGNDVQPVTVRVTDLIWGAIGAGIVWLAGRASSGRGPASAPPVPGAPPAPPPVPPQPPTPVLVNWVTDGNPCPVCVSNEAGSPYAPGDVPPFPQHPRCKCELVPVGGIPAAFFLP